MTDKRDALCGTRFSMASADSLSAVQEILRVNALPHDGMREHIHNFCLAWAGNRLIATVGVELLGSNGLLRSLCVTPDYRGHGLAAQLCDRIETYSRNAGVNRLYLLTTTARTFFAHRGFALAVRESAPLEVRETAEFRFLCPSTATCMSRVLPLDVLYLPTELLPLRPDVPGTRMWAVSLERTMLTYFEVEAHARFDTHAHQEEQITTVVEGELFFELNKGVICLGSGGVVAIPVGFPHAVFTRDRGAKAFDAWSPPPNKYRFDGEATQPGAAADTQ